MSQAPTIDKIRIQGFRSLANVEVQLPRVAVLIGANGSGKSNFIRFFELMHSMAYRRLSEFVARQGGADDQLFGGSKRTQKIHAIVTAISGGKPVEYEFSLHHANPDNLVVTEELFSTPGNVMPLRFDARLSKAPHAEAKVGQFKHSAAVSNRDAMGKYFANLLQKSHVFQFHDTSSGSRIKQRLDIEDNASLRPDGGNLSSILLRLERDYVTKFDIISHQIRRILPVFDRFETEENYGLSMLRWKAKGSDKTIGPHLTSDGSLRFFSLVTLLNLPDEMLPSVLLIDEPELGLHPAAMELVAHMIVQLANERQVILATQSPYFVDFFGLDQTIVLDIREGCTNIRTLDAEHYKRWLKEYTPSALWNKNLIGGRP